MITREQALTLDTFHAPRRPSAYLAAPTMCDVWRRNGRTQTWKTRPTHFRVPVKYGLYEYDYVTHDNSAYYFAPLDCPACQGRKF